MANTLSNEENRKESREERKERIHNMFVEYEKTGDQDLRSELITEHIYIAEILAKKYVNRGIEYDDLLQVASVGLIYAVDRYDVSKGFEFSSFATPTIVGEIKRHFRDKGWTIRVPRRIQELSKKINVARTSLSQELQRQPKVDEIAERLDVSVEDVLESMEASQVYTPQSLDKTYDSATDDSEMSLSDFLGVEDEDFDRIEFNDVIEQLVENLNDLEKNILYYRYYDKRTQVSIAEEFDISQMTVSRIEKKIIQKFRDELNLREEDYQKKKKK